MPARMETMVTATINSIREKPVDADRGARMISVMGVTWLVLGAADDAGSRTETSLRVANERAGISGNLQLFRELSRVSQAFSASTRSASLGVEPCL